MASPNLDEITVSTLRKQNKKVIDNVLKNNACLTRLESKGNVKTVSGGRTLTHELTFAENSTFKRYSGYEAFAINPSNVLSAAEYAWKQAVVAVIMSGLEELQNSGEEALIDLLEVKIANALSTMKNNIASDVYSNGTADGGRQIGGLQLLVADTPTSGTVGGIDRSSYSFWQNQSYSGASNGGAAVSAANIQDYLTALVLKQTRGNDKPDLAIFDNNYYQFLHQSFSAIQRITDSNSDVARCGFQTLKFMGMDCVFDGGFGGACPSNHAYLLNTDYIHLTMHKERQFSPSTKRIGVDQDAFVKPILFAGNLTMGCAFVHGVLKA